MAIVPTGAIYKSLVFDGESSRDYGIYITGQAVYNAPERDVEMINIPGRNGSFALDKGRFQNIEVTYPAGIFADNEADFAQGISDFRNFLCSRNGYVRLTDDYNPNEYRMAVYKSGLDVSPAQLKAGEFQLVFDCKPQRFLTSGEEPITIGEWHETETASGEIASFEAEDGDAVKSLLADIEPIQSLNGYDKPWSGGAGKNKVPKGASRTSSTGLTFTVNDNGSVTIKGTASATDFWGVQFTIPAGTYILNGCPSGGGGNTYLIDVRNAVGGTGISGINADVGNGSTFTINSELTAYLNIRTASGYSYPSSGLTFYPMIRLSSVSDATYEPYSNICPISGYDSVVVSRCGRNICTKNTGNNNAVIASVKRGQTYTFSIRNQGACGFNLKKNNTNGAIVVAQNASTASVISKTFTADEDYNVYLNGFGDSGYTFVSSAYDYQLELGSTATTYEPYQGNTYTINLNGTRYGGTLDVVSGVLTVDRAISTYDGTEGWVLNPNGVGRFYLGSLPSGIDASHKTESISNIASYYDRSDVYGAFLGIGSAGVYFNKASASQTLDEFTSQLATTNAQLVYPLATPTTVQLTAQEVELLVGLNQVWANSGDVSVEYGTAPNVVINPTLFESSPMLEVEGYGSIGFNGYEIDIENGTLGEVTLWDRYANAVQNSSINKTVSIPSGLLNNGDTFYVNGYTINGYNGVNAHVAGDAASITSYTHSGVSDVAISCRAELGTQTSPFGNYYAHFWINVRFPSLQFEVGTPLSYVDQEHVYYTYMFYGSTASGEIYIETSVEYDGDSTITFSERGLASSKALQYIEYAIPQGVGISSNPIMGHPTYIDCDLGEAYKIEDGAIVSLNQYIDLGSDLPKFASGANEIIYDDTITDLKVAPRWWKI